MTTSSLAGNDLFNRIAEMAIALPVLPAYRLETGPGTAAIFKAAAPAPTEHPGGPHLAAHLTARDVALYGIPVVDSAELEPGAWRLLRNDKVITEGAL